jgi:two-component system phosphate regulon response regulator OmpR
MATHVLICDDEAPLRRMVAEYLTERGYACSQAENARSLREQIARRTPDIIILDVRMPGEDGVSALRAMRAECDGPPVIMLTAVAEPVDRIIGLEFGADDYLGKPVDLRELEARIKAVLRRGRAEHAKAPQSSVMTFDGFTLDVEAARLIDADGVTIEITAMELALLKVFLENRGRVMSRDRLLDLAHHRGWEPFDRSIDLRISRLRRKIEPDPSAPRFIRTVRGIGYCFSAE